MIFKDFTGYKDFAATLLIIIFALASTKIRQLRCHSAIQLENHETNQL